LAELKAQFIIVIGIKGILINVVIAWLTGRKLAAFAAKSIKSKFSAAK